MSIEDTVASLKSDISKIDSVDERMVTVARYAKSVTGADRCSLFVYHKEKDQLRSLYADGIHGTIALRSNAGIVGYAFHKKESILENNTSSSSIFLGAVDKKSGYHTKTVLAVPILDGNNNRYGVIQLLNKEAGFSEKDKKIIEAIAKIVLTILVPPTEEKKVLALPEKSEEEQTLEDLQNRFGTYLEDKKLFFMDDGNVYYKILDMIRDYYIGADKCYLLETTAQKIPIYYYSTSEDFLSVEMFVKIDEKAEGVWIAKREDRHNFTFHTLEKD